jgi:hypothetical protein
MVVGFTSTCVTSAYHHKRCEYEARSRRGVLDTTLCDKVCQWRNILVSTKCKFEKVEYEIYYCHLSTNLKSRWRNILLLTKIKFENVNGKIYLCQLSTNLKKQIAKYRTVNWVHMWKKGDDEIYYCQLSIHVKKGDDEIYYCQLSTNLKKVDYDIYYCQLSTNLKKQMTKYFTVD